MFYYKVVLRQETDIYRFALFSHHISFLLFQNTNQEASPGVIFVRLLSLASVKKEFFLLFLARWRIFLSPTLMK